MDVTVRVRPLIEREKDGGKWYVRGDTIFPATFAGPGYKFDHVFDERSKSKDLYHDVIKQVVISAMQGINGTVFAYGQTSSGKTHTVAGSGTEPGIIPLAVQEIFQYIRDHKELEFTTTVSYYEIYMERICDLLGPAAGSNIKIREDKDNNVRLLGLECVRVADANEVTRVINAGNRRRMTGETDINTHSSRSHSVLSLSIETRCSGSAKVASLSLVDLAGSESLAKTGTVEKVRMEEAKYNNKSLLTLTQVISRLPGGKHSLHIPYRDSKLTHILKQSLGGNARTAIICTVTPADSSETELTLKFASSVKRVRNRPIVNELVNEETLRKKLKELQDQLLNSERKMEEKERVLEEKERKMEEKERVLEERERESERKMGEKESVLEERERKMEEKERVLEERGREMVDKDREMEERESRATGDKPWKERERELLEELLTTEMRVSVSFVPPNKPVSSSFPAQGILPPLREPLDGPAGVPTPPIHPSSSYSSYPKPPTSTEGLPLKARRTIFPKNLPK